MSDAIATVVLAGMMFIPIINLVVGPIVGTALFGVTGGFAGAALAVLITIAALNGGVGKSAAPRQLVAAMENVILLRPRTKKRSATREEAWY
jgi:hypothetical protein